jgi:hypothetical protein
MLAGRAAPREEQARPARGAGVCFDEHVVQRGYALTLPSMLAMTMQTPLSPAADMLPDWLWAAMSDRGHCRRSPNGRYGIFTGARGSLRLYARKLHDLGPLVGLVGDEFAEFCWRKRKHRAAQVSKPRLEFGIGKTGVDFHIQLVDDFGWRVPGRADAGAEARLIARHELADRWEVRQRVRARRGRHCERAQPASPDILYRCDSGGEVDLHLPAEQVGERGSPAAIRHVDHVDAGHHVEPRPQCGSRCRCHQTPC